MGVNGWDILNEDIIVGIVHQFCLDMVYVTNIDKDGVYDNDRRRIMIRRGLSREEEDKTILHEWIHAAEDYLTDNFNDLVVFKDIDRYARRVYRKNPSLVKIVREKNTAFLISEEEIEEQTIKLYHEKPELVEMIRIIYRDNGFLKK